MIQGIADYRRSGPRPTVVSVLTSGKQHIVAAISLSHITFYLEKILEKLLL